MKDMFDITNVGKDNKYNPLSRIPESVKAVTRMVLFVFASIIPFYLGKIRISTFFMSGFWLMLFVWQLLLFIKHIRKKKADEQKAMETEISETEFMKQLNSNFSEKIEENPSESKNFQNRFNKMSYNSSEVDEEDMEGFEEYDLSDDESTSNNSYQYSEKDGF